MSELNGVAEDVSYLDLDKKIKDMQRIKISLSREISQNQLLAGDLREGISALNSKIADQKKSLLEIEGIILKRQGELGGIDSKLAKESRQTEAEKRDLIALREAVSKESALFNQEKQSKLEELNVMREQVSRELKDLERLKNEAYCKIKDAEGQLGELNSRRAKVQESEIRAQEKENHAERARAEAEVKLREAQRVLDEANAKEVSIQAAVKEVSDKQKSFAETEAHIKTCYNDIESKKKELEERERDVVIDEDAVRTVKDKLRREIHYAAIEKSKKEPMKKELGPEA